MEDLEAAASQFLRALRGKRSQQGFARRLGYSANPITHWERGRRFPAIDEALRACRLSQIDVVAAFGRFHPGATLAVVPGGGQDFAWSGWLQQLRGSSTQVELAARAGVSRFSVGRWLSGKSTPRLPEFFSLVDAITGRLPELVAELVSIDAVPALTERHRRARAAQTLAMDEPWTEAVLRVLETVDYQALPAHVPGWIAGRLGLDDRVERHALSLLVDAGVIALDCKRYRPVAELSVRTQADMDAMLRLRSHWAEQGLRRAGAPGDEDFFAYNVISVSLQDADRIRDRLRAAFREIGSLVAASTPTETAGLIMLQFVDWRSDDPA